MIWNDSKLEGYNKWATPFIQNQHSPVEDFEKVYQRGGVNFQMHIPSMLRLPSTRE